MATSEGHCQILCYKEARCVSYNLGPLTNCSRTCELSDSDDILHPNDLQERGGFSFSAAEVRARHSNDVWWRHGNHHFGIAICVKAGLYVRRNHKHKPCVNRDDARKSANARSFFFALVPLRRPGSHVAYACSCELCLCLHRTCKAAFSVWQEVTDLRRDCFPFGCFLRNVYLRIKM